jgi:hypothetical protein
MSGCTTDPTDKEIALLERFIDSMGTNMRFFEQGRPSGPYNDEKGEGNLVSLTNILQCMQDDDSDETLSDYSSDDDTPFDTEKFCSSLQ